MFTLSKEPSQAGKLFTNGNAAITTAVKQVFIPTGTTTGAGNLYRLRVENNDTSANYLQVFDALVANVTLGTTAPLFTLLIPASSMVEIDPNEFPISFFSNGMSVAATTTRTGSTANTNGVNVLAWYRN